MIRSRLARCFASLVVAGLLGCGALAPSSEPGGSSTEDLADSGDTAVRLGDPDAGFEPLDAAPRPDAAAADSFADLGAVDTGPGTPPWLVPDATYDVPPYVTVRDDAGCLRLWTATKTGTLSAKWGAGGVTVPGGYVLRQGALVGDFDVSLEVDRLVAADAGLTGVALYVEGDTRGTAGVGYAKAALNGADFSAEVFDPDFHGNSHSDSPAPTAAKLRIQRVGSTVTVSADGLAGYVAKHSIDTFPLEPLHLSVEVSWHSDVSVRLVRFEIAGGGGQVQSDGFACDSFIGE